MPRVDERTVLIVGAGPTGLTLAIELARRGIIPRLVDRAPGPSAFVKASELQPRTLEILEDIGLVDRAMAMGTPIRRLELRAEGRSLMDVDFGHLDAPYPMKLGLGQVRTEHILSDELWRLGGGIERETRLVGLEETDAGVLAELIEPDGVARRAEFAYVVGCDGARSTVRGLLGLALEGETFPEEWILGDVRIEWDMPRDVQVAFMTGAGDEGTITCQPLPGERYQVAAPRTIPPGAPESSDRPTVPELQDRFDRVADLPGRIHDPVWLTSYRVHQRTAASLVIGRVILAGDAGHLSSPVGGVGMNTGIQDAYNLGWKLALAIEGAAAAGLVASYEAERKEAAARTLAFSARGHRIQTMDGAVRKGLRNHAMRLLSRIDAPGDANFREQSQTSLGYRESPIVDEDHGVLSVVHRGPRAGDRVPDAHPVRTDGGPDRRLFQLLRGTGFDVLVIPPKDPDPGALERLRAVGAAVGRRSRLRGYVVDGPRVEGLERIADPTGALRARLGARGEAMFVVRPDGYIGMRAHRADPTSLTDHLAGILR